MYLKGKRCFCIFFVVMVFCIMTVGGCGGGNRGSVYIGDDNGTQENESQDITPDKPDKQEIPTIPDDPITPENPSSSDTTIIPNNPLEPTHFTVIFDSGEGSYVAEQIVPAYTEVVKPEDPKLEGYVFLGWLDENGSVFDFGDRVIYYDMTLSAKWGELLPSTEEELAFMASVDVVGETTLSFDNSPLIDVSVQYFMNGAGNVVISVVSDDPLREVPGLVGNVLSFTGMGEEESFDLQEAIITFKYEPDLLQKHAEELCEQYNSESFDISIDAISSDNLAVLWYDSSNDIVDYLGVASVDRVNCTLTVSTKHFCNIFVALRDVYDWFAKTRLPAVRTDNVPYYDVVMALDYSGSMSYIDIQQSEAAAQGLVDVLADDDYVSVIAFADYASAVVEHKRVGDGRDEIKLAITSRPYVGGGTNFVSALTLAKSYKSLDSLHQSLIVLLSDGGSSVSDSLLQELKDNGQKVVTVGIGNGVNTSMMQKIADNTGGSYLYAENANDLQDAFLDLQNTYIGSTKDTDKDGLPDLVESSGMRDQYGKIWRTNPNRADSDGDGKTDGEEMGDYQALASTTHFKRKSNPNLYTVQNNASFTVLPDEMYLKIKSDNTVTAQFDIADCRYLKANGREYLYSPAQSITVKLIKYPPTMTLLSGWPKIQQEEDDGGEYKHYAVTARLSYAKDMIFDPAIWEINVDGTKHQVNLGGIWHLILYNSKNYLYSWGDTAIKDAEDKFVQKLSKQSAPANKEVASSAHIENLKKQIIKVSGTSDNEDDCREAFARAILEGMADFQQDSDANTRNKFSNQSEMSSFIAAYLPKNQTISVQVNGKRYNVKYTMTAGSLATATVYASGSNARIELSWSVKPGEAMEICNNYLKALENVNSNAWTKIAGELQKGVVLMGIQQLSGAFVMSLCDGDVEKASMKALLKNFWDNQEPAEDAIFELFKDFRSNLVRCVRDFVPNGGAFITTAHKISTARKKLEEFNDALVEYSRKKKGSSEGARNAEAEVEKAWGSFKSAYEDISNKGFFGNDSIFERTDNLRSLEDYRDYR